MHPIHDSDVQLLLAVTLSAKRKPAPLTAIIAALDMLHGSVPPVAKLSEAFSRLGTQDLIKAAEDGFTLTTAAQAIMTGQPKKATTVEQIFSLKEKLAPYAPTGNAATSIDVSAEQLEAAVKAHRVSAQGAGKNLLMPVKSKETENKRAGPGRRPMAKGARKPSR
jgi:hypothetical protein